MAPLEGVLEQDLLSPFFFLSFLYPEKTDFHKDRGLEAASSRRFGLGFSGGRPSPLDFLSFLFLRGEKSDDLFLLFPLEPSDEVTEPSGPPESDGGEKISSLVVSCLRVGSSGPLWVGYLGDSRLRALPLEGTEEALWEVPPGGLVVPAVISISFI